MTDNQLFTERQFVTNMGKTRKPIPLSRCDFTASDRWYERNASGKWRRLLPSEVAGLRNQQEEEE